MLKKGVGIRLEAHLFTRQTLTTAPDELTTRQRLPLVVISTNMADKTGHVRRDKYLAGRNDTHCIDDSTPFQRDLLKGYFLILVGQSFEN